MADEQEGTEPDPRFTWANERTFLAWNRTALALIAAGLAVAQFFDIAGRGARIAIAGPLVLLGAAIALTSRTRWIANQRAIRLERDLPTSRLPLILSAGIAIVAAIAVVVIVIDLAGS